MADFSESGGIKMRPKRKKTTQEAPNEFEAVLKSLRKTRSRNPTATELQNAILDLIAAMEEAQHLDFEANRAKKPAMHKMQMLQKVVGTLSHKRNGEWFVTEGGLNQLRSWLSPLPDKSSPNFDLTKAVLKILSTLPVSTEDVQKSNIGKVVASVLKDPREPIENREMCQALVQRWLRDVFDQKQTYAQIRQEQHDQNAGFAQMTEMTKTNKQRRLAIEVSEEKRHATILRKRNDLTFKVAPASEIIEIRGRQYHNAKDHRSGVGERLTDMATPAAHKSKTRMPVSVDGKKVLPTQSL